DERAVFDAGDVAGIGAGPVAVRALGLVEPGERAGVDELLGEAVVFLRRAVAPVDVGGLEDRGPVGHPLLQAGVAGRCAHGRTPLGDVVVPFSCISASLTYPLGAVTIWIDSNSLRTSC